MTSKHSTQRRLATLMLLTVAALLVFAGTALAQEPDGQEPDAVLANLGTAFTYQGRLVDDGNPASGVYDFKFRLFDAASGGSLIGVAQSVDDLTVSDGLFTADLDFGAGAMDGQARWLEIDVKRDAEAGYTTLNPRVALTAAPNALALPGLWTQQNAVSPNLVGGYHDNMVGGAVEGAVIGGGGHSTGANQIHDDFGTIGGGSGNAAGNDDGDDTSQPWATVGGGLSNIAGGNRATVGGGASNSADGHVSTVAGGIANAASGQYATVGGGRVNSAAADYATIAGGGPSDPANATTTNNRVYDDYGAIGGGGGNRVGSNDGDSTTQQFATVAGGRLNTASGPYATTSGGVGNAATTSYTTVSGGDTNNAGAAWATVGGGNNNNANGQFSVIGGGQANETSFTYATVSGGWQNTASEYNATVSGGAHNNASARWATIGGGEINTVSGEFATIGGGLLNSAAADYTTIAGGGPSDPDNSYATNNRVYDDYGTIGGGGGNIVGVDDMYIQRFATVAGGVNNSATGAASAVGGGGANTASGSNTTVGGGSQNTASDWYSTVGGGYSNDASGHSTTVGGGYNNTASNSSATVGGGLSNIASGASATVPGGASNTAGGDYSFAAGRRAQADHDGAFVWADSANADFTSLAADTFSVRAGNGARVEAYNDGEGLRVVNAGADGIGIYVEGRGASKTKATLKVNNTESSGGIAAYLTNDSTYANAHFFNSGSGEVLWLQNGGTDAAGTGGGDFIAAVNQPSNDTQFRVSTSGEVFSDVGYNSTSADIAELLPAAAGLEPGDVLAVGSDGLLVRSSEAYQATVVGVYSTQPGFVGGMPVNGETAGKIPMAVVGIVPVKASGEGGKIQPGDLLAASSIPGHAMRCQGAEQCFGRTIGKALEPLDGDTGVITMLVILQ